MDFYTQNRLQYQIDLLMKENSNEELKDLWPKLKRKIPEFFENCGEIIPALLHGDLWGGNVAETDVEPGTVFILRFYLCY